MRQIEQIINEIEKQLFEISNHDGFIGCVKTQDISNYKTLRDILDFIESLEKEPQGLDEAAEEYGRKEYAQAIHFWNEGMCKHKPEVMKEDFVNSFKAGAEWRNSQFPKLPDNIDKAANSYRLERDDGELYGYNLMDAFKAGAKWMAEQGETIESCVIKSKMRNALSVPVFVYEKDGYQVGDKIIVQIRKREE